MTDTIFAQVMRREIPADIVCQDELVTAFHYVPSQEPTHIIIAPNKPVAIIADVTDADEAVLVRMIRAATRLAEQAGVERQDTGSSLTVGPTSARKFFTSTCTWSVVAHSEGCCRIPEGCPSDLHLYGSPCTGDPTTRSSSLSFSGLGPWHPGYRAVARAVAHGAPSTDP